MKKQVSIAVCLTFISLAGCTQENATTDKNAEQVSKESNQPANAEKSPNEANPPATENPQSSGEDGNHNIPLSQEDVLSSIKEQFQDSLTPKLPKHLPLSSKEMQLSAATHSEDDFYRVIFFESKKAIPVNDKELNDKSVAKPIAVIEAKRYDTVQEAESKVGYTSPEDIQTGNPPIDLGHSIKGHAEAGAGNKWVNWHEGRWYLQVHASNIKENNDDILLAKRMVDFLESNTLPVPNQYGAVKADVNQQKAEDNRISWQEGTTVYTVSEVEDPINMLEIATHFDDTEK